MRHGSSRHVRYASDCARIDTLGELTRSASGSHQRFGRRIVEAVTPSRPAYRTKDDLGIGGIAGRTCAAHLPMTSPPAAGFPVAAWTGCDPRTSLTPRSSSQRCYAADGLPPIVPPSIHCFGLPLSLMKYSTLYATMVAS